MSKKRSNITASAVDIDSHVLTIRRLRNENDRLRAALREVRNWCELSILRDGGVIYDTVREALAKKKGDHGTN